MIHATTVPATAQANWPQWWRTAGMGIMLNVGDVKFVAFTIPASVDIDAVSSKLAVGDVVQYGSESIAITEVYKAGYDFNKVGYPQGSVKGGTLIFFYKSLSAEPYTLQAVAIANVIGLRLQDSIAIENAILASPAKVKTEDSPVKNPAVVTPVGEGLPDTINQLSQLAIIGGLVALGIMAFKKYAR